MSRYRRLVVFLFLSLLVAFAIFEVRMYLDFFAIPEAADDIRGGLTERGYQLEGWLGDWVREPDSVGGCEVRFEFYDQPSGRPERLVHVQARRSWVFGRWHITDLTEQEVSKTRE